MAIPSFFRAPFAGTVHTVFAFGLAAAALIVGVGAPAAAYAEASCGKTIRADVVALDQPLMFNRLGAQNINGMMFALRRDVVATGSYEVADGTPLHTVGDLSGLAGKVMLRADKRPRPLVLRVAEGDCLEIAFTNLLAPNDNPRNPGVVNEAGQEFKLQINDQVKDRHASFHPQGMELADGSIDPSFTGNNPSGLAKPGNTVTTTWYAKAEGAFLAVSYGATIGADGAGGNIANGLFGLVTVEPKGARFYRSLVNEEELRLATTKYTEQGHPVIDYEATYPDQAPWTKEGKAGQPILNLVNAANEMVHSPIDAIVAGPDADGSWDSVCPGEACPYPLERVGKRNPTLPNRLEAFREFSVLFHDEVVASQVLPKWFSDPVLSHTLHSVRDSFMINYGSGGIGSEIIGNRLGIGPMHDCLGCAYEEFFLTSFAVGDVAQLVDTPANWGLEECDPALNNCEAVGPKANYGLYPDDPSNVHHSYTGDFIKFRNVHAGPKEQHIFHLHNHQWLFNPNDDNSNYMDAQGIGPGSSYTYEIAFGGSGNRNKTAGDAIYHCHFYPHFAQGMWAMWRNHDTFEAGTKLAVSEAGGGYHQTPFELFNGTPANNKGIVDAATLWDKSELDGYETTTRALPDGEVVVGMPTPAVVPLPGKPMAPMPGKVTVVAKNSNPGVDNIPESSQAKVDRSEVHESGPLAGKLRNPGYPFWIAGIEGAVGQRGTTPPLDMDPDAGGVDGGLPRHVLDGYLAGGESHDTQTRLDFSKEIVKAKPIYFPETGTDVEDAAMAFHEQRCHNTYLPDGSKAYCDTYDTNDSGQPKQGGFITNGGPRVAGAPFNEPCVDDEGDLMTVGSSGDFFGANGLINMGPVEFGADAPRMYKAAVIQTDTVFNKVGYHYPQQRMYTLWEDVAPTMDKTRPPEPFVLRLNTFDCASFLHANLVPKVYELDDYQVRTPTDVIGQHIHLPKWDLTSADGAANGWNYEDGTLAAGHVRERIKAINKWVDTVGKDNRLAESVFAPYEDPNTGHLAPQPHPFFGTGPGDEWLGARTTIQRWFADPVVNTDGVDRGLGIIFTHDHYGPSTHQQVGLYATVLTEPAGSKWVHNETGEEMYTRHDGGPTSWQAAILSDTDGDGYEDEGFREFYFEFADFQHAYQAGVFVGVGEDGLSVAPPTADSFRDAINPSVRQEVQGNASSLPDIFEHPAVCPGGVPRPCPEAVDADDPGMLVVNYRNEPVGMRVYDPNKTGIDGKPGTQADGLAGDLAYALQTRTDRAVQALNTPLGNTPYPALTGGVQAGDPFTPLVRVYPGDQVKIRGQSGAHEEEHALMVHGVKWSMAGGSFGTAPNSGWRNAIANGISEQFTFDVPMTSDLQSKKSPGADNREDYLYSTHTGPDGWWTGTWGIMRSYLENQADLYALPNNPEAKPGRIINKDEFVGVCPAKPATTVADGGGKGNKGGPGNNQEAEPANLRAFEVVAVAANDVLGNPSGATLVPYGDQGKLHEGAVPDADGGTLVYNARADVAAYKGVLHDPTALMYVRLEDLEPVPGQKGNACSTDKNGVPGVANPECKVQFKQDRKVEPLVLRANAGDCVEVTLYNRLPQKAYDLASYNTLWPMVRRDRGQDGTEEGMTSFNNNLVRPSSHAGLHTQLLEYDVTQHDGTNVGVNPVVQTVGPPTLENGKLKADKAITFRWYAGHHEQVPEGNGVRIKATPVEFGSVNLMPADKIEGGQKGLVGALIVEPQYADWTLDVPGSRMAATVQRYDAYGNKVGEPFKDFVVLMQKTLSHRYGSDGKTVENLGGEGPGFSEDSQDMGQMAINYLSDPLWHRFGLAPNSDFGHDGFGGVANAHEAYSNKLTYGADPQAPVYVAQPGQEVRLRMLLPAGNGRGSTMKVHGHGWQRDPYVCPGSYKDGLTGRCGPDDVASQAIGDNPIGMYMGGQEGWFGGQHFDFVLPSAGGSYGREGDYLIRDQSSFGNLSGLWGILRVEE